MRLGLLLLSLLSLDLGWWTRPIDWRELARAFGQFIYRVPASSAGTVTPNDSSLVRMVICWNDGVPYQVINASPYVCNTPPSFSHTYYVRTDGNNANAGTSNSAGGAWATLAYGEAHAVAGDVVRVQAGTYVELPDFTVNGSAGSPITLVGDGTVIACGFTISTQSYIRLVNLSFNANTGGCSSTLGTIGEMTGTNTGLELWDVDITGYPARNANVVGNPGASDTCTKCIIVGGGYHGLCDGGGSPCSPGGGANSITLLGADNFIGYTDIYAICYLGIVPAGDRGRYVNNYFHGMIQCDGSHPDFFYANSSSGLTWSNTVVEASYGEGTPTSNDNKFQHVENPTANRLDVLWRFNRSYNLGSSFYSLSDSGSFPTRQLFYNNSVAYSVQAQTQSDGQFDNCGNVNISGSMSVYNTICVRAWTEAARTSGSVTAGPGESGGTFTKDYNLGWDNRGNIASFKAIWTNQVHEQSNVDPGFVDVTTGDLHLTSGGGARGVGGPITTATSCSGTTLNVASNTGGFFIPDNAVNLAAYSGKLVPGDFLTINSTTYQVSSRSSDALTLSSSLSCSNGDAVYYGNSSTVDMGAYPYKASYALTATKVNPSGASNFEARVYPRYASSTRWAVAN